MTEPLVSVIVPAFDAARFLPDALRSLSAQTYEAVEVVVVDDGSTDGTHEVAATFDAVRCIRTERRGPAAARNTGVAETSGELVAFLDADDLWPPTKLRRQVDHLLARPALGFVLGRQQVFRDEVDPPPAGPSPAWFAAPTPAEGLVALSTVLVRRAVLEAVGPFDELRSTSEDTEWLFRAGDAGVAFEVMDGVSLLRRTHARNLTADVATVRRDIAEILHRRIQRRREG